MGETLDNKEQQRRTNRELHSSPIHRHIIQSDMMIHLCDQSIHIGPRRTTHRCIIHTHTQQTSTRLVQCYTATWSIYKGNLLPLFIFICSLPLNKNTLQRFSRVCLFKLATPNFIDAFAAKGRVTVWPSASYNIDRAVFCRSRLRPFGCNIGRRTGVMSMQGAYGPIKATVPIPAGRPWWIGQRRMKGGRQIKPQWFFFFSYCGTKSAQNKGWTYTL